MTNFQGLHTALSGIRAGQTGLDTASNNIANAGTDGYTRQRVELSQRTSLQLSTARVGTGVDIDGVTRMREGFLDTRVRTTSAQFAYDDARASLLQRTEAIFSEPDTGLSGLVDEVWDAFEDLANDPSDAAARQQALSALSSTNGRFHAIERDLGELADDSAARLASEAVDLAELLAEVDELNREIASAAGDSPNDLLDRRDLVVDELASLTGATASVVPDGERAGRVVVEIGGLTAVETGGQGVADVAWDAGAAELTLDGVVADVGGSFGAEQGFLAEDLPAWRDRLDQFALDLAEAINDTHRSDTDDPAAVPDLLDLDPAEPAATVAVADGIGPDAIRAGHGDGELDGANAAQIADLRDSDLGSDWRDTVVELGRATATATREADASESLLRSATRARQSAHTVSLDEEMVSLLQHQRALEASSRVMTAIDEALQTLISGTGIVGR